MNIVKKRLINNLSNYSLDLITELMKSRGIIKDQETPIDVFNRVVESLLTVDTKLNNNIYDNEFAADVIRFIEDKTCVFGTPILTNAGRKGLTTAACTVIKLEDINGVLDLEKFKIQSTEQLSNAIGTGYDLSELKEPSLELLKMNEILNNLDRQLTNSNKRPVASMATLRADHPKILEFINTKQNVDYDKWRLNMSVFVTEKLFQLAEEDGIWELKEYNQKTSQDEIVKTIPAKQLLYEIAKSAHCCGEPGILFKDRFDKDNSTPQWEYKSTAPCAEVAMAPDEVCQFSYINLTNLIKDNQCKLLSIMTP
jgi:ribonucleoside-diphosphate reductase alpha chain